MLQVGSIQRVTFRHIRALTEGGIVMVGSPGAIISDVTLEDVDLTLVRLTGPMVETPLFACLSTQSTSAVMQSVS